MEFRYEVRVPKDRVAVVIGKKGVTRRLLSKKLDVKLRVEADEGLVVIDSDDSLKLMVAKDVIKSIARGFNPNIALYLIKEDFMVDFIDIADFVGAKKNQLERVRSRLIGTEGKARRNLSNLADCDVVIYGKTISIIGKHQYVAILRRAVETLISGNKHASVYRWLEERTHKLRREERS
jgi:ribosomal RNA assembly protein